MLESNDDKSFPFQTILVENTSDNIFTNRDLLYVSVRHIFTSFNRFMWIPNSISLLYKISSLSESQAFLKSRISW